MNRRKFFAFLPLAPVAACAVVEEAKAKPSTEGAPLPETPKLMLQACQFGDKNGSRHGMITFAEPVPGKQVSMAVGDDGSLWIKNSNQEWKRVVTE